MLRVFFKNKKNCLNFFDEVKKGILIKNWKEFANFLDTSKSMIENYRQRRICIPENRFDLLLSKLREDKREYYLELIEKRDKNWGQIIGGKKAYLLNKKEFDKGRRIAIRTNGVKYDFNINMPLSEELCEIIGAIIGDGFTNKYKNFYQTQITGDGNLDSEYYYNRLKPICEKIFNISPKVIKKNGWIRLNIYSKRLFEMLTKRFNIPAGKKSYTVVIPSEILGAKESLLNSTLKGMFNTDGGVSFDKRKAYKIPYIRVNYTSVSKILIDQVHHKLLDYSINHSIHKKKNASMIQINGINNVKRFMSRIGFSNKRYLDKIKNLL